MDELQKSTIDSRLESILFQVEKPEPLRRRRA